VAIYVVLAHTNGRSGSTAGIASEAKVHCTKTVVEDVGLRRGCGGTRSAVDTTASNRTRNSLVDKKNQKKFFLRLRSLRHCCAMILRIAGSQKINIFFIV